MPRLAEFLGIEIVMHFSDHPPPPHSRAEYGGEEVLIDFEDTRSRSGIR